MSVFWRCDVCDRELSAVETQPEFIGWVNDQKIGLRVIREVGGSWNGGTICDPCLFAAFKDAEATIRLNAGNLCDRCDKPSTHVTTPGGFRGCDDHFQSPSPSIDDVLTPKQKRELSDDLAKMDRARRRARGGLA